MLPQEDVHEEELVVIDLITDDEGELAVIGSPDMVCCKLGHPCLQLCPR